MNTAAAAVRQYSLDTLQAIRRDLGKNPRTYQPGSWESERNSVITTEIKRRLSDLMPPPEIVEAAEKVRVWMETNGYSNWQLGGVCDRRIANQRDQMEATLMLAARWGISSDGYSAEVSSRIRRWIINGMRGDAPKAPDYYPANVKEHTTPRNTTTDET